MVPVNLEYNPDFLNEEERCEHIVSKTMKKLWLIQLDMVNKFIQVCDKYNLKYWAEGGTLLGAVRHGGYVPWDDDIDLLMMREDYMKFLSVADKEFDYPYYINTGYTTPSGLFTKIRRLDTIRYKSLIGIIPTPEKKAVVMFPPGICIDIFCADNCPNTHKERIEFHNKLESSYSTYSYAKNIYKNEYHNSCRPEHELLELKNRMIDKLNLYNELCQSYNDKDTDYIFNNAFPHRNIESGHMRYKEDYEDCVYLPFEMLTLRCPKGYERVLDMAYTQRTKIPWQTYVKNLAYHDQSGTPFLDFDNSFTKYTIPFYDKPEDLKKIPVKWI